MQVQEVAKYPILVGWILGYYDIVQMIAGLLLLLLFLFYHANAEAPYQKIFLVVGRKTAFGSQNR